MCHVIFGALLAYFFLKGAHRHRHYHHDGPDCRRGGRRRRGRGRRRRGGSHMERAFGELLKRRLDIDEDQEGIVDQALGDIRKSMKNLKSVMADSRGDLADAFTGKEVDEASLAAVFGHQDEEVQRLRREIVFALKQIHAVLDAEQRELAVEWLRGKDWR